MSLSTVESRLNDDGQELVIRVKGRFDFSLQREFRNAYAGDNGRASRYVVDLGRAEYLDSSALGMLLLLREHAGNGARPIRIAGVTPPIEKILRIANFHQLFQL